MFLLNFLENSFQLPVTYKLLFFSIILIILLQWIYQQKFGRSFAMLKKIPQIQPHIILGNLPLITGGVWKPAPENLTEVLGRIHLSLSKIFFKEDMFLFWNGWKPMVVLNKPEIIEIVLSSHKLINKSDDYNYFQSWVGTGLFTSNGDKWRMRRKMLTPAFHYKILNDFIPIINEKAAILVEKLKQMNGQIVNDLSPYITTCTLDIICETAMGVKINAQDNPESQYIKSMHLIMETLMYRFSSLLGLYDWTFYRTKYGKNFKKCLHYLHDLTDNVIKNRKREFIELNNAKSSASSDDTVIGLKKRLALLDLLLEKHLSNESVLSEEDIREEVDTFVAAGHDTVLVATSFALYLLGLNMEIQQKVYDEIMEIFGYDNDLEITSEHLKRMRYTECVIKEALRIYPSGTMIGRKTLEEFQIKDVTIPKGTSLFIFIPSMHNNPEIYSNPQEFNPDRFLPENILQRHPYAYLPFSAGPRNCIGQKFALIEEKIILSSIIRKFIVKSLDERDKMRIGTEIVNRLKCPLRMQFIKR